MSIILSEQEVEASLARLLKAAKAGEEIILTSGDVAFAKVVPVNVAVRARKPGAMPELLAVPDEFYEPLSDEELADWK